MHCTFGSLAHFYNRQLSAQLTRVPKLNSFYDYEKSFRFVVITMFDHLETELHENPEKQ